MELHNVQHKAGPCPHPGCLDTVVPGYFFAPPEGEPLDGGA